MKFLIVRFSAIGDCVMCVPIAAAVDGFVGKTVTNVLASDQFSQFWVTANRKVQQGVIAALSGNPAGAVSIQGDRVVLDTGDLIEKVKQRLVDRGLSFAANIPVPPAAQRQIVLLTSPQLAQARLAYAIAHPVAQWLLWVVLAMFVLAIVLSRRRPRMLMATGIAIAIGALVIRVLMATGSWVLTNEFASTTWAVAQAAFYTILTNYLLTAVRVIVVIGVILAIIGWYLSGTRSAVATRRYVSGVLSGAGERADEAGLGATGAWFARTRMFWRAAIAIVAGLILFSSDPLSVGTVLWTALLGVLALVVVEFLAAAGRSSTARESAPQVTSP